MERNKEALTLSQLLRNPTVASAIAKTVGTQATTAKTIAETKGIPEAQEANLNLKRKELEILKERLKRMPKDAKNQDDLARVNLALKNLDLRFKPGQLQREQTIDQLGITEKGLQVSALPGKLDREKREGEGRILAQSIDIDRAAADLARDAEKYDVYSASERAKMEKDTETADLQLKLEELGEPQAAGKPLNPEALKGVESAVKPIDIATAAGGDALGWYSDYANWVSSILPVTQEYNVLGLKGLYYHPERIKEKSNIQMLKSIVVPLFLKQISTHGGKWARDDVMEIIPDTQDTNARMTSKIHKLIPAMRKKLVEAHHVYTSGTKTASLRNHSIQVMVQFSGIIEALAASIGEPPNIPESIKKITGGAPQGAPPPSSIQDISTDQLLQGLQQP